MIVEVASHIKSDKGLKVAQSVVNGRDEIKTSCGYQKDYGNCRRNIGPRDQSYRKTELKLARWETESCYLDSRTRIQQFLAIYNTQ